MKGILLSLSLVFGLAIQAQTSTDSIKMGSSYVNDIYYSLENGEVGSSARDNWHLGFVTKLFDVGIHINESIGMELYEATTDTSAWSTLDTTGMSWVPLHNSDSSWSVGAFNANATGGANYGWGDYNGFNHNVYAAAIYVLKLPNGDLKKMIIDRMDLSGTYTMRIADLDGSNEETLTVQKLNYSAYHMIYMDLTTNTIVSREPTKGSWDIVFTKYMAEVAPGAYYSVTGVLTAMGNRTMSRMGVPVMSDVHDTTQLSRNIGTIGYNWKSFDLGTSTYTCADSLTYFIERPDFNRYKLYFTEFEGSSTGGVTFNKTASLNLSVESYEVAELNVYPNPATDYVILEGFEDGQWGLINAMGQVVRKGSEKEFSVSDLKNGLYFLNYISEESAGSQHLLIQH